MGAALGACQSDLYAAEAATIDGLGRSWRRVAEAQSYIDDLVASAWFFEQWPDFVRCVVERRGSGSTWSTSEALDTDGPGGRPTEAAILVADGALNQPTLLHELAHLLAPVGAGHGPAFAETLLTLVRHEMGFYAFADLYHELRARSAFRSIREGVPVP